MTSAPAQTPPPAAAAPPAPPAAAAAALDPWTLAALARPAVLRPGSPVSVAARMAFDRTLVAVGTGLERTLDRPLMIEIASPAAKGPAGPPAFGVAFSYVPAGTTAAASGQRVEGMIAIDSGLARAVLDVIETDFARVRGSGGLTESEAGLLEYVTLACVDAVLKGDRSANGTRAPAPAANVGRTFALCRFLRGPEIVEWVTKAKVAPVALAGRIAGQGGVARLYLPGWEAGDITAPPVPPGSAPAGPTTLLTLRLALPSVRLPEGPGAEPRAGDVVLLSATGFGSLPGCRLVTTQGWEIATATVLNDTPGLITVRCGAIDPRPWDAAAVAANSTVVGPTIGSQLIALEQLAHWQAGFVLDLPKESGATIDLWRGGGVVARGELVRLDNELGIRLTEVTLPPTT